MVQPCNSGAQEHSVPDGYADFSLMIIMIRDNCEHMRGAGSPSPAAGDIPARLPPGQARPFLAGTAYGLDNAVRTGYCEWTPGPVRKPSRVAIRRPPGSLFLVSYEF